MDNEGSPPTGSFLHGKSWGVGLSGVGFLERTQPPITTLAPTDQGPSQAASPKKPYP